MVRRPGAVLVALNVLDANNVCMSDALDLLQYGALGEAAALCQALTGMDVGSCACNTSACKWHRRGTVRPRSLNAGRARVNKMAQVSRRDHTPHHSQPATSAEE